MDTTSIISIFNQLKIPIKEVLVKEGLIENINKIIHKLGFEGKSLLLVSDQNIYLATKDSINKILSLPHIKKLILKNPKASSENVRIVMDNCSKTHLIIAIGSGTINDLCKLASFELKIPYIIFASAPSMNGFCSESSSILVNGHKKTIAAHLPLAAYFDLNILRNTPERLIKAGIGDIMCFSTCQFDWLLSHLILGTIYNPIPFEILKSHQKRIFEFIDKDIRDSKFIKLLSEALIISGIGMYICKGSYPASQGEHLIAHYLEMKYPSIMSNSYHGEQIAVTTLTMAKIQNKILESDIAKIKNITDQSHLSEIFGEKTAIECKKELDRKKISNEKDIKLSEKWPEIKGKLRKSLIPYGELLRFANQFELPTESREIGVEDKIYQEAITNAHLIRDRFTALDME